MADGEVKTDGNSASDSSSDASAGNSVQTPTGEQSVTDENGNKIPYGRFKEVVDQRNAERAQRELLESRFKALEDRLQTGSPHRDSYADVEVKRLTEKLGIKEEAAREIVTTQQNIARAERSEIENRLRGYELKGWQESLASEIKDYRDLIPDMEKAFGEMAPHEQQAVLSSKRGLRMLYSDVRLAKDQTKASDGASPSKSLKQAASSTTGTGSSAPSKLSSKAIREMSITEYKKRLPEINEALSKGLID